MLPSIIPVTRQEGWNMPGVWHLEEGGGNKNSYRIFVGKNCSSNSWKLYVMKFCFNFLDLVFSCKVTGPRSDKGYITHSLTVNQIRGTLHTVCYLNKLLCFLPPIAPTWYSYKELPNMQDGALSHFAFSVRAWLVSHFPRRWISHGGSAVWPARRHCSLTIWFIFCGSGIKLKFEELEQTNSIKRCRVFSWFAKEKFWVFSLQVAGCVQSARACPEMWY